jgi:hypothetical protein
MPAACSAKITSHFLFPVYRCFLQAESGFVNHRHHPFGNSILPVPLQSKRVVVHGQSFRERLLLRLLTI